MCPASQSRLPTASRSSWVAGLLVLCTLLGSASPDAPVVGRKLEKRIEDLEVRLNRLTQFYSDIYWRAIVGSVEDLDLQLSSMRRKRAAIGDEARYLFNLHYNDNPGRYLRLCEANPALSM